MPIANFILPGTSAPSFPEAAKAPSAASGYAAPPATVSVSCAAFAHRSPPRWSCLPAIGSRCVGTGAARSVISGRSPCMFAMSPFRSRFMRSPQPSAVTVRQLAMPATWSRNAATIQRSTNSSRSSSGPSRLYFVRTECSAMSDANRAMVKLLRFLARGQAREQACEGSARSLQSGDASLHIVSEGLLAEAVSAGLVRRAGGRNGLCPAAGSYLRRAASMREEAFIEQHGAIGHAVADVDGGPQPFGSTGRNRRFQALCD